MDFSNYDLEAASEQGIEVEMLHPATFEPMIDDDGVPLVIVIEGKDSKAWKIAGKQNKAKFAGKAPSEDEHNEAIIYCLAKATIEWRGTFEWEGKKYTMKDAEEFYSKPGLYWVVELLLASAGDRSKLFLGQPKGS